MNSDISYIGAGSNINPEENILEAFNLLSKSLTITKTSTFYRTKPLFNKDNNEFINGVWQIISDKPPLEIKTILNVIEKKLKRIRTEDKNAARTIDLDLILFSNHVINTDELVIPDPDIYKRPFLAFPLLELNPKLIIPPSSTPIKKIIDKLDKNSMIEEKEITKTLKKILKKDYK